jgi:hypothetical protein
MRCRASEVITGEGVEQFEAGIDRFALSFFGGFFFCQRSKRETAILRGGKRYSYDVPISNTSPAAGLFGALLVIGIAMLRHAVDFAVIYEPA